MVTDRTVISSNEKNYLPIMSYNHLISTFRICAILFSAFLYSCSSTDEGGASPPITPEPENNLPFDISVFATGNEAVYQVDILENSDNHEVFNLTQSLGVPIEYREVEIHGSKVTFFAFGGGGDQFWQKDVITGNSLTRIPICDLVEEEYRLFPLTSGEKLGLLTTVSTGHLEWNNYLKVYDPATSSCSRFFINDTEINGRTRAKLHKDRFYIYAPEDPEGPSLSVISTNTGEQLGRLTFDRDFRVNLSEDLIYIIFHDGNYRTYKLNDLSLEQEGTIGNLPMNRASGIYNSTFRDKKMVFDYPYAQPSRLSTAPAIYDWETNTLTQGGDFYLSDAITSLAMENGQSLGLTVTRVNLENNILVAGYKDYGQQNKGGIIYLNFQGEVLLNIPLDYIPFEILIRN